MIYERMICKGSKPSSGTGINRKPVPMLDLVQMSRWSRVTFARAVPNLGCGQAEVLRILRPA